MIRETLDLIEAVRRACLAGDGVDPLDEAVRLRLKHRDLDGAQAWTHRATGFALRHGTELDLAVAPDARGSGVGGGLAAQAVEEPGPLSAWSHGDHPAAARLADRHGFERTRELWVMRLAASVALDPLVVPKGIEVRGYRPADKADLLRVNGEAFQLHPEQGGLDERGLAERMAEPWWDPGGLLVAVENGRMIGFHWTKQHSDLLGEVYVVAIAPEKQGRRLGRLLTLIGLHRLRSQGVKEIVLYVESDNEVAIALYHKLGFTHAAQDSHLQYSRS